MIARSELKTGKLLWWDPENGAGRPRPVVVVEIGPSYNNFYFRVKTFCSELYLTKGLRERHLREFRECTLDVVEEFVREERALLITAIANGSFTARGGRESEYPSLRIVTDYMRSVEELKKLVVG